MESSSRQPPPNESPLQSCDLLNNLFEYPKPNVDVNISNWLHQICPPVMSSRSETHSDDISSLGDSTYDFVDDTDEESRDGNTTESVASTDFGRPDDVASLADTEQSDDEESESERSRATGGIPAFNGLDGPVNTPTIGQSVAIFQDDVDRTLAHSIEFEEPQSLGDENVFVKHTIADFNEEETARIVEQMALRSAPKRLVATIRQTMTRQGLSTREPLRILYVGCHTAKQDIIRKVASSVAASVGNGPYNGSPAHRSSQLFHVVPITAFGSEKPPEIELMQSSGYQINVEDCTSASNIKLEDESDRPDILRLVLEGGYSYYSTPDGSRFFVEPAWELPHVAIFYCSENDTVAMRRTRMTAKIFMSRHKVPSIVISHKQLFDKSFGGMTLDPHAIHMCLESRDPKGRGNFIHQRLPIDLDSFKTIDARQMNRNLAYLTGLHEPLSLPVQQSAKAVSRPLASDIEKTSYNLSDSVSFIRTRTGAEWRALIPVGILLMSVFAAVFTGALRYQTSAFHGISINGNLTFTEPMPVNPAAVMTSTTPAAPSLMTSTETRTATKTITVIQNESPISNSLAIKPSMELGNVGEKAQAKSSPIETKSTLCVAEVLGEREILIRMPSATKMSWLSEEAMLVNVSRENTPVEVERLYNSKDGIVLQFTKEEAYGVLNISVITKKKPKVNETFQIDFGTSPKYDFINTIWTGIWEKLGARDGILNNTMSGVWAFAESAMAQSQSITEIARQQLGEVNKAAAEQAAESGEHVTKIAKAFSLDLARWSAILSKEAGMQMSEAKERLSKIREELKSLREQHVRYPLSGALVRAQVQSKLYWLRIQGRHAEYSEYEQRAAMVTKRQAGSDAKARLLKSEEQMKRSAAKKFRKACHKRRKNSCGS